MGSLVPGASYVYERHNGVTYSYIVGSDPATKQAIGWDSPNADALSDRILGMPANEIAELLDIYQAAKHNIALQHALDNVIVLHRLSKTYE